MHDANQKVKVESVPEGCQKVVVYMYISCTSIERQAMPCRPMPQDSAERRPGVRYGTVHAAQAEGREGREGGEDRVRMIVTPISPPVTRNISLSLSFAHSFISHV